VAARHNLARATLPCALLYFPSGGASQFD